LLFHRAIEMRKVEMVRIFLSHGTDVEMKDSSGQRALHRAVGTENTELIQLILGVWPCHSCEGELWFYSLADDERSEDQNVIAQPCEHACQGPVTARGTHDCSPAS
jgi:hypothetical protein